MTRISMASLWNHEDGIPAEAKQTLRRFYAEAVKLDPTFAAAWARLARTDSLIFFLGDDATQERRDAARHALEMAIKLQPDSTDTLRAFYREAIGFAQLRSGDKTAATKTLLQARNDLDLLRQRDLNNPELAAHLGAVNAYLGEKEIALQEAEKAVAFRPSSQDPVLGPALEEDLARVEAEVNEKDQAIVRLQKLLQTPYSSVNHAAPITPALLRLHPYWDPLRD